MQVSCECSLHSFLNLHYKDFFAVKIIFLFFFLQFFFSQSRLIDFGRKSIREMGSQSRLIDCWIKSITKNYFKVDFDFFFCESIKSIRFLQLSISVNRLQFFRQSRLLIEKRFSKSTVDRKAIFFATLNLGSMICMHYILNIILTLCVLECFAGLTKPWRIIFGGIAATAIV